MDPRLRKTLKLSIPAVVIACIGPAAAVIRYPHNPDLVQYYLYLIMFPFFCVSVYFSLKENYRALAVWLGMLFYFLYWSAYVLITSAAIIGSLLFMLTFSLVFACIVAGWSFLDLENFEFGFGNKIPRCGATFVFLATIILIVAPIVAMHYLSPDMYESVRFTVPERMSSILFTFFGDLKLRFLYYDSEVRRAYFKIGEPLFLYAVARVTVFMYLPFILISLYLLLKRKKSGDMLSLILLTSNGISAFLFLIPSVAAVLIDYTRTVFVNTAYLLRYGYDIEKLVTVVVEMKMIVFFTISVLSAILAFVFVARLEKASGKDTQKG